jgi:hypothetical protein
MKKSQYDYQKFYMLWKGFFISKGFRLHYEDKYNKTFFGSFRGCQPELRADIYAGRCRTNTETGGCICVDFTPLWDKLSKCPIYFDLTEKPETVWQSIEMLMDAGKDFSCHFGRIIKQGGGLAYDPPIFNIKEKTQFRKNPVKK